MTIVGSALGTIALGVLVVLVVWWAERGAVGRRR